MDEKRIAEIMKTLELTREEAIELLTEDEEVDRMSVKEAESDLTPEQKKAVKKAKNGARAVDAYGKPRTREKKEDKDKRYLMEILEQAIQNLEIKNFIITNEERQIDFEYNQRKFRVVLSAPRK